MRSLVVAAALLLSLSCGAVARAQDTGSSFGGGDWGSDDTGGGSDFGGGGGGSDWGGGGSDWGGGGSGSTGGGGTDFDHFGSSGSSFGGSDSRRNDPGGTGWNADAYGSRDDDYGRSSHDASPSGAGSYRPRGEPFWKSGGFQFCCCVFVLVVIFGGMVGPTFMRIWRERRGWVDPRDVPLPASYVSPVRRRPAPASLIDVSAISLAIDWRERKRLQTRLAELARSGNTRDMAGLTRLLHETVIELRRVETAWLYAGATNAQPASKQNAHATFQRAAQEMRSRYGRELVRAAEGGVRHDEAPAHLEAKPIEGPGVVVVTVVVAARGQIPDIANARDGAELENLMRALGAIDASHLVALEVIWSPSAEDDRMSTAELEALYPELRKIDPASLGGRVFCGYCAFPYPQELLRCPECGAPAGALKNV